jgi:Bacterial lectin
VHPRWFAIGVTVALGACSFAWDGLDPRLEAGTTSGGARGDGATGGSTSSTSSTGGGATGGAGGATDPCARCPESCGDIIEESFAVMPDDWSFNGVANFSTAAMAAELTPPSSGVAGTVFRNEPVLVDHFSATFEFRISDPPMNMGGGAPVFGAGDGLAFALQTNGPNALGDSGGGLGVGSLDGFAVELDTFQNSAPRCTEPSFDHVALIDLFPCALDGGDGVPTTIAASDMLADALHDSGWHQVAITFDEGTLSVDLDDVSVLSDVALPGFVPGAAMYVGFGAGTGGAFSRHHVRQFSMSFPTPRCL